MTPTLSNAAARRIFIDRHALADPPTPKQSKAALAALIRRLGFVQVDSIQYVERAHHMILFARNQTYRQAHLAALLEDDRALFENFTHDASVIPSEFFPYWRRAMADGAGALGRRWDTWRRPGFREQAEEVLREVARRGPCLSREVGAGERRSNGGWWDWNPSKTALEWNWRTGRLCICRREGFQKVYDLTENVIPPEHLGPVPDRAALVDWACGAALDRLGFGTTGDLAKFWGLISPAEAKDWAAGRRDLIEVAVEGAPGEKPRLCLARPGVLNEEPPAPPPRVRALSPFDPLIRDRKRVKRLFGFDYTIEIFVPAAQRKYGYYVFPLLEGDRLIGRIDMKADRAADALAVRAFWPEPKTRLSRGRLARLEAELDRQRRFAGMGRVTVEDGWIRA